MCDDIGQCYLLHTGQYSPASCCVSRCRDTLALCAPHWPCLVLCSGAPCTHSGFHNSGHERAAPGDTTETGLTRRVESQKIYYSVKKFSLKTSPKIIKKLFQPVSITAIILIIHDKAKYSKQHHKKTHCFSSGFYKSDDFQCVIVHGM